jgi:hypothetical protein
VLTNPTLVLTVAATALIGLIVTAVAMLRGWRGWLELKRAEIEVRHAGATPPPAGARIEIADLKERIRKLEAIAAGVDY